MHYQVLIDRAGEGGKGALRRPGAAVTAASLGTTALTAECLDASQVSSGSALKGSGALLAPLDLGTDELRHQLVGAGGGF